MFNFNKYIDNVNYLLRGINLPNVKAQEYDNYDDNKYSPYPTEDKQI